MVVTAHARFLAVGWHLKADYTYLFNDRFGIGGRVTYHSFFQTRNSNYKSVGINVNVKF
ncbi:MAG: hypothetical protein HC817_02570 [Saprospiraceae bacterium]|nr:hypothetical protein [Saprospiraceae bacterium]